MHWVALLALVAGLAAGSTTAAEPGKCTLVRIAEWAVRSPRGQPVVDGAINGQQVGVMLDTGAARSIILRSAADRLALIRYNSRGSRMIGGQDQTGDAQAGNGGEEIEFRCCFHSSFLFVRERRIYEP